MRFYAGCHKAGWLADPRADFPPLISHRTLAEVKILRSATHPRALDSGDFTELSTYEWRTGPADYVRAVVRYDTEIGGLDWAASRARARALAWECGTRWWRPTSPAGRRSSRTKRCAALCDKSLPGSSR